MIKYTQYIKAVAMIGLMGSSLVACSDKEDVVYVDEIYQRAFISGEFYPQSEGQYKVSDVVSDPSLYFDANSRLVLSPGGLMTTTSGSKEHSLTFQTLYAVKKSLSASLAVLDDAQSYIDNYNSKNGLTDEDAFKLLPPTAYTIINGVSTIPVGKKIGTDTLKVQINDDLTSLETGNYLLPLTIKVDDASIPVSESMKAYNLKFIYSYTDERTGSGDELKVRQLVYNTDFTASVKQGTNYTGSIASLFDNSPSTIHMLYNGTSDVVIYHIDFKTPVSLAKIGVVGPKYYSTYSAYYPDYVQYILYTQNSGTVQLPHHAFDYNTNHQLDNINNGLVTGVDVCLDWGGATYAYIAVSELIFIADI